MQYVKVIGDSHADAMKKLRATYGEEAFIYHEKEIPAKTMFSRIVGKKQFEIQAALREKKDAPAKNPLSSRASSYASYSGEKTIPVKIREVDVAPLQPTLSARTQTQTSLQSKKHAGEEFLALLEKEGVTDSRKKFNLEEISLEPKTIDISLNEIRGVRENRDLRASREAKENREKKTGHNRRF